MVDSEFHDVSELDKWLPGNEWVQAMIALIHWGFAFDKSDKSFRLRKRRMGERRQYIVPLLSGVTLPRYLETFDEQPTSVVLEDDNEPFSSDSSFYEIPTDEQMVIDTEGKFVLSAPDMVTETIGILAKKGAGKTYLANVIAEEFLGSGFAIPFVVVDPTGVWRGLGADIDGQPNDHRLVVFGGEHGHYPLQVDTGKLIAKLVVGMRPLPVILDLSKMLKNDQQGFVADFVGELYFLNKDPLHLFIDEADSFAPQRLDRTCPAQKRSLSEVDNFIRRGRTRGLGATLITQRAAVINKNVLSQVGAMFFLRMAAPQDMDAAERWMEEQVRSDVRRECRHNLPILAQGQAYYLRGGDNYTFSRFTVRKKTTFDASVTPRMGREVVPMSLAPLSKEDRQAIDGYLNGGVEEVSSDERSEDQSVSVEVEDVEDDLPVLGQPSDNIDDDFNE